MEDANIKISSVVSKVFGVSSLAMICALPEKDGLVAVGHQILIEVYRVLKTGEVLSGCGRRSRYWTEV